MLPHEPKEELLPGRGKSLPAGHAERSQAKHLQYLLEYKQMQILRFAQDDGGAAGTERHSAVFVNRGSAQRVA